MKITLSIIFAAFLFSTVNAQTIIKEESRKILESNQLFNSVSLTNGLSAPLSDFESFASQGFNSRLTFKKELCSACNLDINLGYTGFQLKDEFIQDSLSDTKWDIFSMTLGPSFSFGSDQFSVEAYGNTGLGLMNPPVINNTYSSTNIVTERLSNTNTSLLMANLGLNINFQICDGFEAFLNTEYVRYINSGVQYQTRDISQAETPIGTIDQDLLRDVPLETKTIDLSYVNMNIGFRIGLGKSSKGKSRPNSNNNYSNSGTRAQDYNSSRSNNSSGIEIDLGDGDDLIIRKRPVRNVEDGSGDDSGGGTRAQDYNSSRSNNSSSILIDLGDGDDLILRKRPGKTADQGSSDDSENGTRAQDYNSSRSNNSSSILIDLGDGDDLILRKRPGKTADQGSSDDSENGTRAQDYNSSRSNNSSSILIDLSDGEDLILRKRPGRTADEESGDNSGNGTRAQDYNSSRSNNSSSIYVDVDGDDLILRKRAGRTADDEYDENSEGGTRAQDYNSSRSNNSSSIAVDLSGGEDLVLRKNPGNSMTSGSTDGAVRIAIVVNFESGTISIQTVNINE